jgi:hypothetical protein
MAALVAAIHDFILHALPSLLRNDMAPSGPPHHHFHPIAVRESAPKHRDEFSYLLHRNHSQSSRNNRLAAATAEA